MIMSRLGLKVRGLTCTRLSSEGEGKEDLVACMTWHCVRPWKPGDPDTATDTRGVIFTLGVQLGTSAC